MSTGALRWARSFRSSEAPQLGSLKRLVGFSVSYPADGSPAPARFPRSTGRKGSRQRSTRNSSGRPCTSGPSPTISEYHQPLAPASGYCRRREGRTSISLRHRSREWIPPPHLPLRGGVNQYHHADTVVRKLYRQSARRHRPPPHQVNTLRVAAEESDRAAPSPRFRPRRRAVVQRGQRRRSPHHR